MNVKWEEGGPSPSVKFLIAGIVSVSAQTEMPPQILIQAYSYLLGAILSNCPIAGEKEKLSMLQDVHDMIDEIYGKYTKENNAQTQASS